MPIFDRGELLGDSGEPGVYVLDSFCTVSRLRKSEVLVSQSLLRDCLFDASQEFRWFAVRVLGYEEGLPVRVHENHGWKAEHQVSLRPISESRLTNLLCA